MTSWPCVIDRDSEMPVISHQKEHFSRMREEMAAILYSGDEEVKNIVDIIKNGYKIIVLMRGLPGSGKSTLARYLVGTTIDTSITKEKYLFSADDYFTDPKSNAYVFNRDFVQEAHFWNIDGVMAAVQRNVSPIIVDNTNLTVPEMWPYVCIAAKYDYIVRYLEPSTHWRYDVHECAKRNLHGVSERHVATMMGRFDRSVSASELFSLVLSQIKFQNDCASHSNSRRGITRYSQQKHYAENRWRRQLHSISTCNHKISKRSCVHSESWSPNLLKALSDPTNVPALKLSRRPTARNFLLSKTGNIENYLVRTICLSIGNCNKETSCKGFDENNFWCFNRQVGFNSFPSSSELIKFRFPGGISSIHTTHDRRTQHQICKSISFGNNVLGSHDQILKWLSFLYLIAYVRNVAICATRLMSMYEMYDNRLTAEKYSSVMTDDIQVRNGCISRGDTRITLTLEHGVRPSVNIDNVKKVFLPFNVRSLLSPAPRRICEGDTRNEKSKESHYFRAESATRVPPVERIYNADGWSIGQSSSGDLKNAESNLHSCYVCDSSKCDSGDVCNNGNYNPWDVCDSRGCNSWGMCHNLSWETEPTLKLHVPPNESNCVLPKPPRANKKTCFVRYSREHKRLTLEREGATEVETNCSLTKPRRTHTRPRITHYSFEEYASMLEPKTSLPPELEAWDAVEDPHSSWERKQNIGSGSLTSGRRPHQSQSTCYVSGNINVGNHEVPPPSARMEAEEVISKPQREKRIRNRH